MTPAEFQKAFKQQIVTIDELKEVDVISDDVQYWINEGKDAFIRVRLKNFKEGIKRNQREVDEIKPYMDLIVRQEERVDPARERPFNWDKLVWEIKMSGATIDTPTTRIITLEDGDMEIDQSIPLQEFRKVGEVKIKVRSISRLTPPDFD